MRRVSTNKGAIKNEERAYTLLRNVALEAKRKKMK